MSRAWDLSQKHWPVLMLLFFISGTISGWGVSFDETVMPQIAPDATAPEILEAFDQAMTVSPILLALGLIVPYYIQFIVYRMMRRGVREGKLYDQFLDALKVDIKQFALFFVIVLCLNFAVAIGLLCCLVPGIFLGIRWYFVPMIAATEDVTFSEAFERSWKLTDGYFGDLFLLGLTSLGLYFVGFCACCVGAFYAMVMIYFMTVLAYFTLSGEESSGPDAAAAADYEEVTA